MARGIRIGYPVALNRMMKVVSYIRLGLRWQMLAMTLVLGLFFTPTLAFGQDDGGEKEKKEKPEKPPKPEKAPKPDKEAKEKPEKASKEKPDKENGDSRRASKADAGDEDGDDGGKKKKKKGKKGDEEEESVDEGGANTANESFHANNADSTVKHGYAVPCARYRRGSMEYIDKNDVFITIRRGRKKEVQVNSNRGQKEIKTRTISRDQTKDKSKSKTRLDKEGKLKDKGNRLVFKIEWTSDCEYKLTFKRSRKPTRFEKGWEMDCIITKCYDDYYDCDCNMHEIIQYASVRKKMTKYEIAQKERQAAELIEAKKADSLALEAQKLEVRRQDSIIKASEDEIFGPIKRVTSDPDPGLTPIEDPHAAAPGAGPNKEVKPDPLAKKPEPEDKGGGSGGKENGKAGKQDKPDKGDMPPKEKAEKPDKGDKPPKEKKEKAPKEPKAPKEKAEKAPKEPKAPKEKPEKAPKEPKEPKAPKAPKEPKENTDG